ncbi:MAG: hypothetical protein K5931_00595, partial [Lachnospiraceae bacterium]|nr:hypothetical protein [Lachnospiraceae bacterium]
MTLIKKITRVNLKAKLICSAIIIFLFLIVCAISFKLQTKTYQYSFELKDMELKSSDYDPMTGHISSEAVSDDFIAGTNAFSLPPGGYVLSISYLSDINTELLVQANNDCVFSVLLPASYGEVMTVTDSVNLVLPKGTDRGRIKLYKKEGGYIELHDITISSDHHIYRDYYLIIAFAGLIAMALIIITFLYDSLKLTSITWPYIVAFLVVMLIVNIPYITSGTYFEIDTQGHMKRIEGLYQGLVDGQIPVLIGPNYANEYGELMVLQPNLFLYIPAILRYFNVSIPTAYNVYMILVN